MATKDAVLVTYQGKTNAGQLLSIVSQLRQVVATINDVSNMMSHMTDGVDFTMIESQFGVPTGEGQTIYNLVSTLKTQIGASSAVADMNSKVNPIS